MITNFHNKKMPKEKVIMLDSFIKTNNKYYPQALSEELKNIQEKIKIENHIDDDLEKVNQIVTLLMKQNVILIMMNLINNFKEIF